MDAGAARRAAPRCQRAAVQGGVQDQAGRARRRREYKARFTPKGFRQKHGVDFFETFARTGMYKTLRVALSLVAKWDHELAQFDVPTAFLNAPSGGGHLHGAAGRIRAAGHGVQAAQVAVRPEAGAAQLGPLVHTFITGEMGFKALGQRPSLYFRRSRSGRLMLIFRFVDDMQGSYSRGRRGRVPARAEGAAAEALQHQAAETATWMLGMRITRDRKARTITLDQELYVTKALEKFGLAECRVVSTPEAVGAADDTRPGAGRAGGPAALHGDHRHTHVRGDQHAAGHRARRALPGQQHAGADAAAHAGS